jgi:hypothetical protein
MYRHVAAACAVSIAVLGASTAAGTGQVPPPAQETSVPADVARALTRAAPFMPAELASLQSGQVITRTEASPEKPRGLGRHGREDQHRQRSNGRLDEAGTRAMRTEMKN